MSHPNVLHPRQVAWLDSTFAMRRAQDVAQGQSDSSTTCAEAAGIRATAHQRGPE